MDRLFVLVVLFSCSTIALTQPIANFQANDITGCVPVVASFEDLSTNAVAWEWDTGIGTSTAQHPTVFYPSSGLYTIRLIVTDAGGLKDTLIREDYVEVYAYPEASFTPNLTTLCTHTSVIFTDLSSPGSGQINSWQWDFGDGTISNDQHPTHPYLDVGTFPVSLTVSNQYGCSDNLNLSALIEVQAPDPDFGGDNLIGCGPPLPVQFTSTGTVSGTHFWEFGDGNTSTQIHPAHSYSSNGSFTVTHTVTDNQGCKDTLVRPSFVNLGLNTLSIYAEDSSVCLGDTIFFHANAASNSTVIWDFGNGDSGQGLHPYLKYPQAGTYQVQATISDPSGCTNSFSLPITIHTNPTANFSVADTNVGCKVPFSVDFVNLSTGGQTYHWVLQYPTSSNAFAPSYVYQTVDSFSVSLEVFGSGGCRAFKNVVNYIKIQEMSTGFVPSHEKGCAPLTTQFIDTTLSPFPLTSWQWNLGDGTSSTLPSPFHTYQDTGWYDVSLITTNNRGCSDTTYLPDLIGVGAQPTANFSWNPSETCALTPVQFTNLSINAQEYVWYFGDGDTAMSVHPAHGFAALGFMDVALVATDRGCADTLQLSSIINVLAPLPIIGLSDRVVCDLPKDVLIQNLSIGADTWVWEINNLPASTANNFTYTVVTEGTHLVGLTVSNLSTGCEVTATDLIKAKEVVADFQPDTSRGCVPLNISFTNQSVNVHKWMWHDGMGDSIQVWEPGFLYENTGSYQPMLTVENNLKCRDTLIFSSIEALDVTASFTLPAGGAGCAPLEVQFLDQSTGTGQITSWAWDLGDSTSSSQQNPSYVYSVAGNYGVSLLVTDEDGCQDSIFQVDAVFITKPIPDFTVNPPVNCPDENMVFVSQSTGVGLSYLWDFGDGDTSFLANPTHSYDTTGWYDISLHITDVNGCDTSMSLSNYIQISELLAQFTADTVFAPCPPLEVHFAADTNFPHYGITWKWDFGNGATSSQIAPSHVYTSPGIYTVSLIVESLGGCSDTMTMENLIVVEGPTAAFTFSPQEGCPGTEVSFQAVSTDTVSYAWILGDGSTAQGSQATHTYTTPGEYVPILVLQDNRGCEVFEISEDTIEIFSVPIAQFNADKFQLCDAGEISFSDQTQADYPITDWFWDFGDGQTSTDQHPQHPYQQVGSYDVQLIVSHTMGCSDTLLMPDFITVYPSPRVAILTPDTTGCMPLMADFSAYLFPHPFAINSWTWDLGLAGPTANGGQVSQEYAVPGNYEITLLGTDANGCVGRDSSQITVWDVPNANFVAHDTMGCAPKPISFRALSSGGITSYEWDFGDGSSDSLMAASHLYQENGLYTVSLTVTDTNGCQHQVTQADLVDLGPPLVEFSADPLQACPGSTISFLDESTSDLPIVQWQWSWGEGDSSSLPSPEIVFDSSGWYDLRLQLTDSEGCTDSLTKTAYIEILLNETPPPTRIQSVSVLDGQRIQLEFLPYPNDRNDFEAYWIYRAEPGGDFTWIASIEELGARQYLDTQLATEGQSYCYKILVVNHCGKAALLDDAESHCSINLQSIAGTEEVQLTWNPYQGWPQVESYRLYRVSDYQTNRMELLATLSGTQHNYLDLAMHCYDTYAYRLIAVGGQGRVSYSDTTFASPSHLLPDQATHLDRVSVTPQQQLVVEWEIPPIEGANKLILQRDAGNGFQEVYRESLQNQLIKYQDDAVSVQQQSYRYQAFTEDSCGDLTPIGRGGNSILLQAERKEGIARLQWNPYEGWEQGVESYLIEVYDESRQLYVEVTSLGREETGFVDAYTNLRQANLCYRITARERGGKGSVSYSNEACVLLEPQLFAANAFTPNGDGHNDKFGVASSFLQAYEFRVFNRWGMVVFESTSPEVNWDGTLPSGGPAPEGVYMFISTGQGYSGESVRKVGSVTLVR